MEALPNDNLTALRESVQRLRKNEGIDFARMNKETGINRSIISTFANGGPLNQKYVQTLDEYVRRVDDSLESGDVQMSALAPLYKTELDLYETSGYRPLLREAPEIRCADRESRHGQNHDHKEFRGAHARHGLYRSLARHAHGRPFRRDCGGDRRDRRGQHVQKDAADHRGAEGARGRDAYDR